MQAALGAAVDDGFSSWRSEGAESPNAHEQGQLPRRALEPLMRMASACLHSAGGMTASPIRSRLEEVTGDARSSLVMHLVLSLTHGRFMTQDRCACLNVCGTAPTTSGPRLTPPGPEAMIDFHRLNDRYLAPTPWQSGPILR